MGKSLVIVESPAKAKTINKYLGKDYVVKSSVGHVRDLPTSGSGKAKAPAAKSPAEVRKMAPEEKAAYKKKRDYQNLVARMGIDPEKGWEPHYEVLPGKEKVVQELKKLAETADEIYLATDLDREGEAIAWHLEEIIGGDKSKYKRVVFNEITKNAIQQAFSTPGELNTDMVQAQQARRFLDRVVGFMVSPLLWQKVARGLSAGRVQSVAVRLLVEREREIKAFIPQEFWDIHADVQAKADALRLLVTKEQGKAFKPVNKDQAEAAVAQLQSAQYQVTDVEEKPSKSRPSAPFITSTMQQAASTRLGYGVKKTMMLAQRLYEAGYITYMRTDSTNLSQDAIAMCRGYVADNFGDNYLPEKANIYSAKGNAQEAHEAIRPSDVNVLSGHVEGVDADAKKLYELIWRQFVACQMVPAQYDLTTVTVTAGEFELKAKGRVLRFDGWTRVQPAVRKKSDEEQALPALSVGDELSLDKLDPQQHFTKPPARYSEASLVKELEKRGIGRPSTYASIIGTIQDRGYVRVENRRFFAEKMGEIVTDRLVENFTELLNYDFTAKMEERLDDIAEGERQWTQVLDNFYADFSEKLAIASGDEAQGGMRQNQMVETDIDCPSCGRKMGIRTASTGVFLGCTGYNLPPKERCTTTMNLTPGEEAVNADEVEDVETSTLMQMKRCPKCETAMDSYLIDETRKLHVCGNNPACSGYLIEQGQFKLKGYDGPIIECDKCGADMELKNGRFGKYFGCTNEDCKNTRKLLKNGEPAPPKEDPVHLPELECEKSDAYFVLRDGAAGIFLAASTFPKSRETRAPKVSELKRFRDRISPKFYYLADAPETDSDGNPAVVRFSRKTKSQYVMTEVDGKATGWKATYENGKWVEEEKKKAKKKK
ncbi:type I DNA topoisomerase [Pseudoalteromonas sp. CnMc7-15]|uniref:type I DNA topoisomerase n=1 Tax=Pseudoalteromonas TaxID=53246 RepID=UPI0011095285|nr:MULTISPECIES: type I DNA topoisomerase [Pseudoalteromonas]MCG7565120.1 type I DNA topoisomerase [Pseudoalteromonas sp. CnMc7-15]MCG7568564.1 type I DNA topoisomerase [Pseudoalteromonas sp. CNC9-20]TLX52484.1 type I DNA topoisomerase [Pseudoalteromonas ruthenica]|tara:strand:- start:5313 stop:7958 length:2646 start_codon:yes stop_codon:yes gene_type:complete